jgi:hypothetical protein
MKQIVIKEDRKGAIEVDRKRLVDIDNPDGAITLDGKEGHIEPRETSEFEGYAIWLDDQFDWALGKDSEGLTILVPLRKIKYSY